MAKETFAFPAWHVLKVPARQHDQLQAKVVREPQVRWRVWSLPTASSAAQQKESSTATACVAERASQLGACERISSVQVADDITNSSAISENVISAATSPRPRSSQLLLRRLFGTLSDHTSRSEASNIRKVGTESTLPSISESVVPFIGGGCSKSGDSSTLCDRQRTEALGKALRATDERTRLLQRPEVPPITIISDDWSEAEVSSSTLKKLAAHPPTDDTQRDNNSRPWAGRGFSTGLADGGLLTTKQFSDEQRGLVPRGTVSNSRRVAMEHYKKCRTSNSAVQERDAARVPARPTQPMNTPRPIWVALRRQTLKVTQADPSIFSRGVQNPSKRGAQVDSTTRQRKSWHIINRRIFGVYETPRKGGTTHPEWLLFAGGVPQKGISEHQRWVLRLGQGCSDDVNTYKSCPTQKA